MAQSFSVNLCALRVLCVEKICMLAMPAFFNTEHTEGTEVHRGVSDVVGYSPVIVNVVLRFFALPASVALSATGCPAP